MNVRDDDTYILDTKSMYRIFLKPIMKRWQVLHMHNFFILINRVSLRKDLEYN